MVETRRDRDRDAVDRIDCPPPPARRRKREAPSGPIPFGLIDLREAGPEALLGPNGPVLSGRPWLMTEGMDPALVDMPGPDTLTRLDWQSLGEGGSVSAVGTPRTQAASAGAPVPYRDPGPAFSRNFLVTRDFSNVAVPDRAAHRGEPDRSAAPRAGDDRLRLPVDVGLRLVRRRRVAGTGPNAVPYLREDLTAGGDPVVGFERRWRRGLHDLHLDRDRRVQPRTDRDRCAGLQHRRRRSRTTAASPGPRRSPPPAAGSTPTGLEADRFGRLRGTITAGFLDKPWLAVGPHPDDPEKDVIYLTYTNFDTDYDILYVGEIPNLLPTEMRTTIELVSRRMADGPGPIRSGSARRCDGRTASAIPAAPPASSGRSASCRARSRSSAPDGTVHVAWLDSTDDESQKGVAEITTSRSTDAGRTWTPPTVASVFNEIEFRPRTNFFRFWASAFPQLAVGPDGELYIVYTGRPSDKPDDDGDIFIVSSTDEGDTWTRPLRLNDDDTDPPPVLPIRRRRPERVGARDVG